MERQMGALRQSVTPVYTHNESTLCGNTNAGCPSNSSHYFSPTNRNASTGNET